MNFMSFMRPKTKHSNNENNKVYISIGTKCGVKFNIDRYIKIKETQFFDWLITDMESVNKILQTNNISSIINNRNLTIESRGYNYITKKVTISSLSKCISLHDLPKRYTNKDINNFITKYIRRYNRLINIIKNNKLKIYFIRHGYIDIKQKNTFIHSVLKINPICNFKLVECSNSPKPNNKNYIFIDLKNFKNNNKKDSWKLLNYNWNKIFNYINRHN